MSDATTPDPALVQWVIRWILTAGEKPPKPDEQKPAPKHDGPSGPLDALDAYMTTLDAEHTQKVEDARATYVDLVARLAPPRTGDAPADGVHALACASPGAPPDNARVLEILRAVDKSPQKLRDDVKLFVAIRERADLVARIPALDEELLAGSKQVDALMAELVALANGYEVKIKAAQRAVWLCEHRRDEARKARTHLCWDQHVAEHINVALRSIGRPPSTMYIPVPAKEAKRAREKAACEAACDVVQAGAARLDYLERAFFPPPPPPPEAPEPQGVSVWLVNVPTGKP